MMAKNLNPCPFCGAYAEEIGYSPLKYMHTTYYSICSNCWEKIQVFYIEDEAIAAWNRRFENDKKFKTLSLLWE